MKKATLVGCVLAALMDACRKTPSTNPETLDFQVEETQAECWDRGDLEYRIHIRDVSKEAPTDICTYKAYRTDGQWAIDICN